MLFIYVCTARDPVCGVRKRGKGVKGTARWNEEVKKSCGEKKNIQRLPGEQRDAEEREKHQEKMREAKRMIRESKENS